MRPIATDGVAWSVCLCDRHIRETCKYGRTDPDAVRGLTHVDPRNHLLDGFNIGRIHSRPLVGDKSAMRPIAKLPWTLVSHSRKIITAPKRN